MTVVYSVIGVLLAASWGLSLVMCYVLGQAAAHKAANEHRERMLEGVFNFVERVKDEFSRS